MIKDDAMSALQIPLRISSQPPFPPIPNFPTIEVDDNYSDSSTTTEIHNSDIMKGPIMISSPRTPDDLVLPRIPSHLSITDSETANNVSAICLDQSGFDTTSHMSNLNIESTNDIANQNTQSNQSPPPQQPQSQQQQTPLQQQQQQKLSNPTSQQTQTIPTSTLTSQNKVLSSSSESVDILSATETMSCQSGNFSDSTITSTTTSKNGAQHDLTNSSDSDGETIKTFFDDDSEPKANQRNPFPGENPTVCCVLF